MSMVGVDLTLAALRSGPRALTRIWKMQSSTVRGTGTHLRIPPAGTRLSCEDSTGMKMSVHRAYGKNGERRVTNDQRRYAIACRNSNQDIVRITEALRQARNSKAAALSKLRATLPVGYKDYAPEFALEICQVEACPPEESQAAPPFSCGTPVSGYYPCPF